LLGALEFEPGGLIRLGGAPGEPGRLEFAPVGSLGLTKAGLFGFTIAGLFDDVFGGGDVCAKTMGINKESVLKIIPRNSNFSLVMITLHLI
jgi:hypothetical protein